MAFVDDHRFEQLDVGMKPDMLQLEAFAFGRADSNNKILFQRFVIGDEHVMHSHPVEYAPGIFDRIGQ